MCKALLSQMNGQLKSLRSRNKADREKIRRSKKTEKISDAVEQKFGELMEKIGEAKRRKIEAETAQIMGFQGKSGMITIGQNDQSSNSSSSRDAVFSN